MQGRFLQSRLKIYSTLLLLSVATQLCAVEVPKNLPELIRPDMQNVSDDTLHTAMQASVEAASMFLLETLLSPEQDSPLVYPAHAAIKKVGEKVVERRYRKEKRPIYETKKVERLVPKKDEYGNVTGYEKKMVDVRVSDRVVGHKTVQVPDPEGDIVRKITVPILDRSNKMLPRGWWGMNAQAIVLLNRCGLGKTGQVQGMMRELERLMNMFGMPDTTWDLAWLSIAWTEMTATSEEYQTRRDALIGRIVDGAFMYGNSRNPGVGMWGPVSINHHAQAKLFSIELELQNLFVETEKALEAASTKRKRKALSDEYQKISVALGEIKKANKAISQQGRRLSEVERPWKMDETYKCTGITYYMYNRDITDIESTAVAALALHTAKAFNALPEVTPREKVRGRILVKGLESIDVIENAYNALFDLGDEKGSFDSGAILHPIDTYDDIPNLAGVPLAITLPQLLRRETWQSHTSALASIYLFEDLVSERTRSKVRDRDEILPALEKRVQDIIAEYIKADPNKVDWVHPHHNEADALVDLDKNNGWPRETQKKKRKKDPATPVDKLSVGYLRTPRALLEQLSTLLQRDEQSPLQAACKNVTYRLLIEQADDGSWHAQSPRGFGSPGMSSGEWTYLIGKLAQLHWWQAKRDLETGEKEPISGEFLRTGPYKYRYRKNISRSAKHIFSPVFKGEGNEPHTYGYPSSDYYQVDMRIAETLAAALYMSAGLKEHPSIDSDSIFEIIQRSQEAKTAFEQALADLQASELEEKELDKQTKALEKSGPDFTFAQKGHNAVMHDFWREILKSSGLTKQLGILEVILTPPEPEPVEEKAEDAAEKTDAEAEANDESEAEEKAKKLDDILGGD